MAANRIYLQVDLSSQQAQANVNALNQAVAQMGPAAQKAGEQATTGFNKVSVSVDSVSHSFSDLNAAIGAIGLGKMIHDMIMIGAEFDRVKRAITAFSGSAQVATDVLNEMRKIADESPFEFKDLQEGARELIGFGVAAQKVPTIMRAISDQVAAFGAGIDTVNKLVSVFGRVLAKDFVSSMDLFRQFGTQGIHVMEALREAMSKQLGKPISEADVRAAIKEGILDPAQTLTVIVEQMRKQTGGFGKNLDDLDKKLKIFGDHMRQAKVDLGDAFGKQLDELVTQIGKVVGALEQFIKYLNSLSDETKQWIVWITAGTLAVIAFGNAFKIAWAVAAPAISLFTSALVGLGKTLVLAFANPEITLAIVGITAALAGVYFLVPGIKKRVDDLATSGWDKIKEKLGFLKTAVAGIVDVPLGTKPPLKEADNAFTELTALVAKHANEASQLLLKAYSSPIEAVYFKYATMFDDLNKKIEDKMVTPEHAKVLREGLTAAQSDELRAEQIKQRKQDLDQYEALYLEKVKGTRDAEVAYTEALTQQDLRSRIAAVDHVTEIRIEAETNIAKIRKGRIEAEQAEFEEFARQFRVQFEAVGINVDDMIAAHRKRANDQIQLADQKAFDESQKYRLEGWKKANDLIIEDQKRIFEGFRDMFGQVFDALTGKAQDMGKAIGDVFKKLAMGELREMLSSRMAGMATQAAGYGMPEEAFPSQGRGLIGMLIRRGGVPPRPPLTAPEPLGGLPSFPTTNINYEGPFAESGKKYQLSSDTFAESVKQFADVVDSMPGVAVPPTSALPGAIVPQPSAPAIPPQASPTIGGLTPGIQGMVNAATAKYNLPTGLLSSVIRAESGGRAGAVSRAGAVGLMQLMPATAGQYGVTDRTDPQQSIDAGAHYLSDMLKQFGGSVPLALAAYNAGPGTVRRYGNQIPPYAETQAYVNRVTADTSREAAAAAGAPSLQSQIPASELMGPAMRVPYAQYAFSGAEALSLPTPSATVPGTGGESVTTAPLPSEVASLPIRSHPGLQMAAATLSGVMPRSGGGGFLERRGLGGLAGMFGVGGAFGGGTSAGSVLTSQGMGALGTMGGMALFSKGLHARSTGVTAAGAGLAGVGSLLMDPKMFLRASSHAGGMAAGLGAGLAAGVGTGIFASGLQKGGGAGLGMAIGGGALAGAGIGFMFGGPLGAAIGAGIGAGVGAIAGTIRLFVKTETERIRAQIKQVYGIDIADQKILGQIKQIVDQKYGGSVSIGIRSQDVQDIVRLFALSTGQAAKLPRPMYSATIAQSQAGGMAVQPVYEGGVQVQNPYTGATTYQYQTAVTAAQGLTASQGTPGAGSMTSNMFVQLNPQQATDLFTGKTVQAIQQNPAAVASANTSAIRSGDSRTTQAANMLEPLTALS